MWMPAKTAFSCGGSVWWKWTISVPPISHPWLRPLIHGLIREKIAAGV
jgi:hypothetical protein